MGTNSIPFRLLSSRHLLLVWILDLMQKDKVLYLPALILNLVMLWPLIGGLFSIFSMKAFLWILLALSILTFSITWFLIFFQNFQNNLFSKTKSKTQGLYLLIINLLPLLIFHVGTSAKISPKLFLFSVFIFCVLKAVIDDTEKKSTGAFYLYHASNFVFAFLSVTAYIFFVTSVLRFVMRAIA